MKLIAIIGGAVLALMLGAALVGQLTTDTYDPARYARAEAEAARIAQQQQIEAQLYPVKLLAGAILTLAPALIVIGATAWGSVALIRFRRERMPRRGDGLLPVSLPVLDGAAVNALGAYHGARQIEAARQPVPHTISYHHAPRLDYRGEHNRTALPAPDEPAPAGTVPSFHELLNAGRIGRGADGRALPLLLGFDVETGAELAGSWLDLYSTAVAGFPGSGKTTTQRFLACQTALHGARFVIIDPQAQAGEESLAGTLAPLASCFLAQPASADRDILEAVKLVADIGERRVQGKDRDMTPIILWADELTKLLGRSSIGPKLAELLESVAQEYRKKRVFVCGSGQIWTADRTTSELRDSFASVIAHRMKRGQARMLLPTDEAAQVEYLATGRAVLWRTSGETTTIAIPLTTAADVQRVAGLLGDGAADRVDFGGYQQATNTSGQAPTAAVIRPPVEAWRKPDGSLLVASADVATSAPASAEAARALAMFRQGLDIAQITAELRGVKSSEGRKYQTAAQEVQHLLRQALGGG